MAATCDITTKLNLSGLGEEVTISDDYDLASTDTAPTAFNKQYRTLAVGGTEEALDMGDIDTTELYFVYIKAIDYDLDVDTSYAAATFSSEITILTGESQVFRIPADNAVYVKNTTGTETPAYEYCVVGLT